MLLLHEETMDQPISYRVRLPDEHDPRGPDGKGWNRIAIFGLGPYDRCTLRPKTRQAALDTLRGMARYGSITSYEECSNGKSPCHTCPVANKAREEWNNNWHIREDLQQNVWLLGDIEKAFSGFGYAYKNWAALLFDVEVPMLKRMNDAHGFYWIDDSERSDK